jgi:hypothetical protein
MIVVKVNKQTNEAEVQASVYLDEFVETDEFKYVLYEQSALPKCKYIKMDGDTAIPDDEKNTADRIKSDVIVYKKYLSNTDWYYARKLETGDEVPADVIAKRIEAREFIRNNDQNISVGD